MPRLSLLFLTGILLSLWQSQLPHHYILISVLLLSLLLMALPSTRVLAMLLAGFAWSGLTAERILDISLPERLIKQDVLIKGRVDGLVEHRGNNLRFYFNIDELHYQQQILPFKTRVRLTWYYQREKIEPDQYWQFKVRLKPPHGSQNPGSFDYESWLFQQRVRATGYVRKSSQNRLLAAANDSSLAHWRGFLREAIHDKSQSPVTQAIFPALLLGDRSAMSGSQWQVLRSTGTSHLLAISGLHIGIVAMLVYSVLLYVVKLSPRLLMRMPASHWAAIGGIVAAIIYALISGFAVPAQRALLMLGTLMLGRLWYRRAGFSHIVSLALMAVLIWDPLSPLSASFWLSFMAVAVLAYAMTHRLQRPPWYQLWPRLQASLFIGLFAMLGFWFSQASWIAPLVNILAIPWVTVVLWALLVAVLCPLDLVSNLFWGLAEWLFVQGWNLLEWLARMVETLPLWLELWQLLLLLLASLMILLPRGVQGRLPGLVMVAAVLSWQPQALEEGAYRLTVLDVGQGLAVVVQTRDHSLVFDTGARFSERYDSGLNIVIPYLRQQRITKVDELIVSHGDNDHIGGAPAVLKGIEVDRIRTSVPERLPDAVNCHQGQQWRWNSVQFRMLHPAEDSYLRGNNRSCVLLVDSPHGSSLLTGDIEGEAEKALLQRYPELVVDILLAPHHGSKTSSSEAFVSQIHPKYVIFSSGYRNRFGFPHHSVVQRYRQRNTRILNTANSGAIAFLIQPSSALQYAEYRRINRRIWSFHGSMIQ